MHTVPHRLPEPPPAPAPGFLLDLLDGERVVGWISPQSIAFLGFANEIEAAHAAWMAFRTLSRRIALREGRRPMPIESEPLRIVNDRDTRFIAASGGPIARLVQPPDAAATNGFGFELWLDAPRDEIAVRAKAHMIYRALRRSGIRWGIWTPVAAARRPSAAPAPIASVNADMIVERPLPLRQLGVSALLLIVAVLAVMVPQSIAVILGLAGIAALVVARLTIFHHHAPSRTGLRVEGGAAPAAGAPRYVQQAR